jgi:hypothetical protein
LRGRQRAGNYEEGEGQGSKQSHSLWVASHHQTTIYQILTQSIPGRPTGIVAVIFSGSAMKH